MVKMGARLSTFLRKNSIPRGFFRRGSASSIDVPQGTQRINDDDVAAMLERLDISVGVWVREYLAARRGVNGEKSFGFHSESQLSSLRKLERGINGLFPSGVEGAPKRIGDIVVVQAIVVNAFIHALEKPSHEEIYWETKNLREKHFHRFRELMSRIWVYYGCFSPGNFSIRARVIQKLRRGLVKNVAEKILYVYLDSPQRRRFNTLRKALTSVGEQIFDVCLAMAKAKRDYYFQFPKVGHELEFDVRRMAEYYPSLKDPEEQLRMNQMVYMWVFPACMRTDDVKDHLKPLSDIPPAVVRKAKVILRDVEEITTRPVELLPFEGVVVA